MGVAPPGIVLSFAQTNFQLCLQVRPGPSVRKFIDDAAGGAAQEPLESISEPESPDLSDGSGGESGIDATRSRKKRRLQIFESEGQEENEAQADLTPAKDRHSGIVRSASGSQNPIFQQ